MAGTIRKRTWTTRKGERKTAWLADYFDQKRRRHTKQFTTKKAADAWLLRARDEVDKGLHTPDSTSLTIAQAAELWLERVELDRRERSTLRNYRIHVRLHINPLVGDIKLTRLTTPMVTAYRNELLRTRSRDRARVVLVTLRMIIKDMQNRGLVAQNVALPVRVDAKSRGRQKLVIGRDVPSKEEVQAMLATTSERWRPFLMTAVFTGMRSSELLGLTWDAVDFERGVIHIRQRADYWRSLGSPKSEAGHRAIPMAPGVIRTLREWRLACPRTADGRLWLVFPNNRGGILFHTNVVKKYYHPLQVHVGAVAADGRAKYGFHKLRHFFASWAIEQGFAAKRLQEILGHSSIMMTYDRYGHWFPDPADDQARLAAGERAVLGVASL
jgi:integrase